MISPNKLPFSVKRKEVELWIILTCFASLVTKAIIQFITSTFAFDTNWWKKLIEITFYCNIVEGIVIGILFITNLVESSPLSQICNIKKSIIKVCIIIYWVASSILYSLIIWWYQSWNNRFWIIIMFYIALLIMWLGISYLHTRMMVNLKKYQYTNIK